MPAPWKLDAEYNEKIGNTINRASLSRSLTQAVDYGAFALNDDNKTK